MTMFLVVRVANAFLHLVSLAILAYFILTLLWFNNRLVELLARFIYPFVKPFRRPAMWVMRRTGLPLDFTLMFSMIGLEIVGGLVWRIYYWLCLPNGLI